MAIIEFTPTGDILIANQNFIDTAGYIGIDDLAGKHHRLFCQPQFYKDNPNFWEEIADEGFKSGVFERVRKDGSELWLDATYNAVRHPKTGTIMKIVKVCQDITEDVVLEREKKEAVRLATQTSQQSMKGTSRAFEILASAAETSTTIDKKVDESKDILESLSDATAQIEKVIQTINGLADQTNLLALNKDAEKVVEAVQNL